MMTTVTMDDLLKMYHTLQSARNPPKITRSQIIKDQLLIIGEPPNLTVVIPNGIKLSPELERFVIKNPPNN
jgi:hypothetical protein